MKTTISNDLIARVSGMTGQRQDWFSPMKPLPQVAPQAEGRMWDFPVGYNVRNVTRQGEGIGFTEMRALADAYDVLRLVIETRKDQLCKLDWQLLPKEDGKELDAAGKEIMDFLAMPDKENSWDEWLRMLLEDMLVLDAATIYPRRTLGGQPYALELMDGSTIKRVIDYTGRTPAPPDVAYQQILKGVPAVDYTREELYYRPRNKRTNKVYGYSPVEQIILTVNIALRRQTHQLQYYTEGNVPEALIGVPETWTPEQIKAFQQFWDNLIEGDTAQRRHAKFVPGAMKYQPTKEPNLKDAYDEWLARVVCFAFSISPQPFVTMMNRATADTAMETALEEGLAPLMRWIIGTMNYILAAYFSRPDLRFEFKNSEVVDPKEQADIHAVYIDRKVLTPDEVRADLGRKPMTPEERDAAFPAPVVTPTGATEKDAVPQDKAGAKEALAKSGKLIDRDRAAVTRTTARLLTIIEPALNSLGAQVAATVLSAYAEVGKSAEDEIERILDGVNLDALVALVADGDLADALEQMYRDGGMEALVQLGINGTEDMLALVNEQAVQYARERAAEMVGMKWVKGKLKPNPSAKWAISEATRNGIRSLVTSAIEEGWSNDRLAEQLSNAYQFSTERAVNIAATETAFADVAGNLEGYRASGIVKGKRWLLAQSDYCPICATNAAAGDLPLDGLFPDGTSGPPAHPRCRCDVIPILKETNQ